MFTVYVYPCFIVFILYFQIDNYVYRFKKGKDDKTRFPYFSILVSNYSPIQSSRIANTAIKSFSSFLSLSWIILDSTNIFNRNMYINIRPVHVKNISQKTDV